MCSSYDRKAFITERVEAKYRKLKKEISPSMTWRSLRLCNYFVAALQIILILACVSSETLKLSPGRENIGASAPIKKYIRKTRYFLLSKLIWLVPAPGCLSASRHFFWKPRKCGKNFVAGFAKNEGLYRRILTKYKWSKLFEGFWRIRSKDRGKKTA